METVNITYRGLDMRAIEITALNAAHMLHLLTPLKKQPDSLPLFLFDSIDGAVLFASGVEAIEMKPAVMQHRGNMTYAVRPYFADEDLSKCVISSPSEEKLTTVGEFQIRTQEVATVANSVEELKAAALSLIGDTAGPSGMLH